MHAYLNGKYPEQKHVYSSPESSLRILSSFTKNLKSIKGRADHTSRNIHKYVHARYPPLSYAIHLLANVPLFGSFNPTLGKHNFNFQGATTLK